MKLDGIRVVDLSLFLPGPTVSLMMADHGADVIKIENTAEGEPNRSIGQRRGGESVYFAATHRGKRSLALDLKDPRGRAVFMRLAATADVVLESFRPGVTDRLGVGYDAVRAVNPKVVYASISAYGQDGPLRHDPAHDLAIEALCGLLSNNVDAQGRPCMPAMPAGDMLGATVALSGILMALLRRNQTGEGDYLDVSMMDSIFSCMPNSVGAVFAERRPPDPGSERIWGGAAFYRIYETADARFIVLGGSEIKFCRNLLVALGREELIPLCELPPGTGQLPVVAFLESTFRQRTQAQWVEFMAGLDVCFAPVNDLRAGFDLEQTRLRKMVVTDDRGHEHIGTPFKFLREPGAIDFRAPAHGEHSAALLRELGYGDTEIAALLRDRVTSSGSAID
ncbi:MAG: CoA transferase [Gammaproteobacteria bacterium]|nr:CoA transferase [Gammaproteobacteria bacterium]